MLKGLKYKLNRETLNTLYKSLVRPMMEYADVLWDGCMDGESDLIEFVQYESAKVVTGAMKGTSRNYLMKETGWEDMKLRRCKHKLIFYFKIVNNFVPNYLKELLPSQVLERTHYSVRSQSDFTLFPVHTERFKKSFFPSATKLWNGLDTSVRNLPSISRFKKVLLDLFNLQPSPTLFNYSLDRYSSIIHTRICLDACALNYYLFKIGCKLSPKCTCGFEIETINHYFLHCPIFAAQRLKLLASAARIFVIDGLHCPIHK
jgi:hypothetical protein